MTSKHDIDNEVLIKVLKGKPELWDRDNQHYKNRIITRIAWSEVGETYKEHFSNLSNGHEKIAVSDKDLLKRWWNIRDSFLRSRKRQESCGNSAMKKYVYSNQLQFLLKSCNTSAENNSTEDIDTTQLTAENEFSENVDDADVENSKPLRRISLRRNKSANSRQVDPEILTKLEESYPFSENFDEDAENSFTENEGENYMETEDTDSYHKVERKFKPSQVMPLKRKRSLVDLEKFESSKESEERHMSFFKGIVPSLLNMDEDDILHFQMGVLQVISEIRLSKHNSSTGSVDV